MKAFTRILALAGMTAALLAAPARVEAQQQDRPNRGDRQGGPPGNFDPEQMRQRMMQRYREQLDVAGDAEWKILEERITKVTEARREAGSGMMGRGMFGPPGGRGGAGGAGGNDQADSQRQNRRNPFAAASLAEADDLQKALDGKASNDELKAKMAKLREARKAKQANLAKAQDDLRKVLSVRQEATAVMMGLLE